MVGQGQVLPVRAKVEMIDNYPTPTTKKELMRFLGMVGFYRCFCRNFSTVVAPLTNLLRGGIDFCWTLGCQQAFENVKMLLTEGPVLKAPKFDQAFQLQVDASNVGILVPFYYRLLKMASIIRLDSFLESLILTNLIIR